MENRQPFGAEWGISEESRGSTAASNLSHTSVNAIIDHAEAIVDQDPPAALKSANTALGMAHRVNLAIYGRADSIKGAGFTLQGDYREAEICFYRATAHLATVGDQPNEAANLRRFAGLRAMQKMFDESRRMLNNAISISHECSMTEYGKTIAALGVLEIQTESYAEAIENLSKSLKYIGHENSSFVIAVHNLMVALVKNRSNNSEIGPELKSLRRRIPRSSMFETRFKWLEAIVAINAGNDSFAIRAMNEVIAWLTKKGSPTEVTSALIDKAQAYYIRHDTSRARIMLEAALQQYRNIHGVDHDSVEIMADLLEKYKLDDGNRSPWEIKQVLAGAKVSHSACHRSNKKNEISTIRTVASLQLPGLQAEKKGDELRICREQDSESAIKHAELLVDHRPTDAIRLADLAIKLEDEFYALLQGRAESIKGAALVLKGDYQNAEICLHRATALLAKQGDRVYEASNLRRFAGLRAMQALYQESRWLLEHAISISFEYSSEEYGKDLAAMGVLEIQIGRHKEAVAQLIKALSYLDYGSSGHFTAVHNLMVALIELNDYPSIERLAKILKKLRKAIPRFDLSRLRIEWALTLALMRLGASNKAVQFLPRVVEKLKKLNARPDEIAAALVDTAQAYYGVGSRFLACNTLAEARKYYEKVAGVAADALTSLDHLIEQLKLGDSDVDPWRARRAIAPTAGLSREIPAAISAEVEVELRSSFKTEALRGESTGRHRWRTGGW